MLLKRPGPVSRGKLAELGYHVGNLIYNVINLLRGVEAPQAKADGAMSQVFAYP
jgi:hypothetical protein